MQTRSPLRALPVVKLGSLRIHGLLLSLGLLLGGLSGCSNSLPTENVDLTDEVLAQMVEQKVLHKLPCAKDANGQPVSSDSLIVNLELYNAPLSGVGMDSVLKLKNLRWVHVYADQMNDDVFLALLKNDSVHKWSAFRSGPAARSNEGFAVEDDSAVEELKFNRSVVTEKSLVAAVDRLPALRRVDLSEFIYDERAIADLAPRGKLFLARRGPGFVRAYNEGGQQATNDDEIIRLVLVTLQEDTQLTSSALDCINKLPNLVEVDLDLHDEMLPMLVDKGMLHFLTGAKGRDGKRVDDDNEIVSLTLEIDTTSTVLHDFSCLKKLAKLEKLNIAGCMTDDSSLNTLLGMRNIRDLSVGQGVSDSGITPIAKMSHLESLTFDRANVQGHGLNEIQKLGGLKRLQLLCRPLDSRYLVNHELYEKLDFVSLECTAINDTVLGLLMDRNMLHDATAHWAGSQWGLVSAAEPNVKTNESIKSLNLSYLSVEGSILPRVSKLPRLESLDLRFTRVSDDTITALQTCRELKELDLRDCNVNDQAVQSLGAVLTQCKIQTGTSLLTY